MKKLSKFLIVIVFALVVAGCKPQNNDVIDVSPLPSTEPVESTEPEVDSNLNEEAEEELGSITGTIMFPSEGIPDDLEVCAETTNGGTPVCTLERVTGAQFTTRVGYSLQLPVGEYHVFARRNAEGTEQRAYYTEFVTCGLLASCPSHKKISVSVTAGQTVEKIDPADWYGEAE